MTARREYVLRCDYCGSYAPLDDAQVALEADQTLPDGRVACTPTVHCSPYCAQQATSVRVGARG